MVSGAKVVRLPTGGSFISFPRPPFPLTASTFRYCENDTEIMDKNNFISLALMIIKGFFLAFHERLNVCQLKRKVDFFCKNTK